MREKTGRIILYVAAVCYAALMLYFLFLQRRPMKVHESYWMNVKENINLQVFDTVKLLVRLLRNSNSEYLIRFAFLNMTGNLLLFVPMGVLLPCIWPCQRKFIVIFATSFLITLCIETLQVLTLLGIGDIDDMILNLLGTMVGYGMWHIGPVNRALQRLGFISA